jgi:hypothetical protein
VNYLNRSSRGQQIEDQICKAARNEKEKENTKIKLVGSHGLGLAAVTALGLHGFSQDIWAGGNMLALLATSSQPAWA